MSGGGYIGGWLAAWAKRQNSLGEVQKRLATNRVHQIDDKEPPPIRFLRVFSNYLTAKIGILSVDTWSMIAIYLRNMLLNQVIVLGMVTTALLLPRMAVRFADWAHTYSSNDWRAFGNILIPLALLLLAFVVIANNMAYLDNRGEWGTRQLTRPGWVLTLAAVPLFFDAIVGGVWLVGAPRLAPSIPMAVGVGAAIYAGIWIAAMFIGWFYEKFLGKLIQNFVRNVAVFLGRPDVVPLGPDDTAVKPRTVSGAEYAFTLFGAAGAGAVGGWLYALLAEVTSSWHIGAGLTFAGPLVLGIFILTGILHIGLMGVAFSDRRRDWWGRLGGWLLLWGLVWTVVFWIALCFPDFMHSNQYVKHAWSTLAAKCLTPTWILTTAASVLAGKSTASGKPGTQT